MRTSIEISDELCRQLKRKAADEGITIRQVVERALRVYLGKQTRRKGYALNGKQNEAEYYPAFGSTTATPFLI
jgi:metal-responsive CopG/Arc/MetJ family transcriptional regulator